MKKIIAILFFCFLASYSFGQSNLFPSVDSLKNYIYRYVRNSTVESFTNLRLQNSLIGLSQMIDSLAGNGAVDSIWIVDAATDTLKYRKQGVTYVVGAISGGGGSSSQSYSSVTQLTDTSFTLNRSNGTKDTIEFSIGNQIDTTSLSNRIDQKLNISDTSAMLNPYFLKSDTTAMLSNYVQRQELKDTASAIRSAITGGGGSGTLSGTFAERIASSPTIGQMWYQTNERIGLWVYNNGWQFIPPQDIYSHYQSAMGLSNTYNVSTAVNGAGAAGSASPANHDPVVPYALGLETGSTSTGRAGITGANIFSGSNYINFPSDTNYFYVMYVKVRLHTAPTSADNYIFQVGVANSNIFTNNTVDSYGAYFRIDYDSSTANIQAITDSIGSGMTPYTSSINASTIDSAYTDFVICANQKLVEFYVNGTLILSQRRNIRQIGLMSPWGARVFKKSGSNSRIFYTASALCYISRRKID